MSRRSIPGVVALYAALVVWLTWPYAAHLTTHMVDLHAISRFDTVLEAWALAWETHALATDPSGFFDANIYAPVRHALLYGPMALGLLPFFAPVFLLSGNPTFALNLAYLTAIVLTATGIHFVVVRWTGSHLAGLIGAATLLLDRWLLWVTPMAPHYAALQYLPLIVLLAADPTPRAASMSLLAGLVALQCTNDLVYFAPAVLVPLGLLTLARLARRRTRRSGLALLAVIAFTLVAMSPLLAGYLTVRSENPDIARQTLWAVKGPWRERFSPINLPWGLFEGPIRVPAPALVLVAVGGIVHVVRARRGASVTSGWGPGLLWASVGVLLSLPPIVHWGASQIPLPQLVLAETTPIYQFIRSIHRLGIGAAIGLSLLAGIAFHECAAALSAAASGRALARLIGAVFAATCLAGMYVEYRRGWLNPQPVRELRESYPLRPAIAATSPIIQLLRAGEGPVLELPAGVTPVLHAEAMYRSIFHWRPLLNGYSGYWPAGFPERMALAGRLPDPDALAALRDETGLTTILVHTDRLRAPGRLRWIEAAAARRDDLAFVTLHGDDLLFRVGTAHTRASMVR